MKTKVIAFRVTEEEYNAIALAAAKEPLKVGDYVRACLHLPSLIDDLNADRKRLEAKAKRAANKAAKEAAANGTA